MNNESDAFFSNVALEALFMAGPDGSDPRLRSLVRALDCGHLEQVDRRLKENLDLKALGDYLLIVPCVNGHVAIVDRLLQDKRFDPRFNGHGAIQEGAAAGRLAVVKRLLEDERVDPSAEDNEAVRRAARSGHLAVVKRLLEDVRVDPSAGNNEAIKAAAAQGHLAVVELLARDVRVDLSVCGGRAIECAALGGHPDVVNYLLDNKDIDPSFRDNTVVLVAARRRYTEIVYRLLDDPRVDFDVAFQGTLPEHRKQFERRERFTEVCIALQNLHLPAWVTMKILKAVCPWSTLVIHKKWALVCAVKHFR
jgi:ankyrin repeat protein